MWLKSITIENYKSFRDPTKLEFKKGMNIIVGQNNSGKSAILETIRSPGIRGYPHRYPGPNGELPRAEPRIQMEIVLSGFEVRKLIHYSNSSYFIPAAEGYSASEDLNYILNLDEITIPLLLEGGHVNVNPDIPLSYQNSKLVLRINTLVNGEVGKVQIVEGAAASIADIAMRAYESMFYAFNAERMNIAHSPISTSSPLRPDASNLPTELLFLPSHRVMSARYQSLVREVLPDIKDISVIKRDAQNAEIRVWETEPDLYQFDPANWTTPLDQCGTGTSQVLALLYIAVKQKGGIVVIDEPNSFLHPGAVRALLGILESESETQYIITTHTTEFSSIADRSTLHIVRKNDLVSNVRAVDIRDVGDLREMMAELGTRISDIFGYQRVVWVEGPTEQKCFMMIAIKLGFIGIGSVSIVPVRATSDFRKAKDAKRIIDIYHSLSRYGEVVAPEVRFSFDKDSAKSPKELEDIKRESDGKVRFIGRKCLENYILDAEAIAAVLSARDQGEIGELVPRIQTIIDREIVQMKQPIEDVDAPKVLATIYAEITEARFEFKKTTDTVEIMAYILNNNPTSISELTEFVRDLLEK